MFRHALIFHNFLELIKIEVEEHRKNFDQNHMTSFIDYFINIQREDKKATKKRFIVSQDVL